MIVVRDGTSALCTGLLVPDPSLSTPSLSPLPTSPSLPPLALVCSSPSPGPRVRFQGIAPSDVLFRPLSSRSGKPFWQADPALLVPPCVLPPTRRQHGKLLLASSPLAANQETHPSGTPPSSLRLLLACLAATISTVNQASSHGRRCRVTDVHSSTPCYPSPPRPPLAPFFLLSLALRDAA